MPHYTLLGTPFSTQTRTVALSLHYKRIPFTLLPPSSSPHSQPAQHDPFASPSVPVLVCYEGESEEKKERCRLRGVQAISIFLERERPDPPLDLPSSSRSSSDDDTAQIPEKIWEFVELVSTLGYKSIQTDVIKPYLVLSSASSSHYEDDDERSRSPTPDNNMSMSMSMSMHEEKPHSRPRGMNNGSHMSMSQSFEMGDKLARGVKSLRSFLSTLLSTLPPPSSGYLFGTPHPTFADFSIYPLLSNLRSTPYSHVIPQRLARWMDVMDMLAAVKSTREGTLEAGGRPVEEDGYGEEDE